MKYEIVKEFPNDILYERDDICISIYMPTHRHTTATNQDKILFKNQIQKAERILGEKYSKKEVDKILEPLYDLEQDNMFWNRTKDGIAMLLNRQHFIIYNLYRDIQELTVVSDHFHIRPLIRVYQSADKYYVLGVNRKLFKLYYGDRYGLRELELPEGTPIKIEDVLGDQYTSPGRVIVSGGGVSFGTGSKKDEVPKDTEKYLRYVDKFVWENYSKPANAPLVLLSLDEYQGDFRKMSNNKYLVDEGIKKDFESMDIESIRKESWKIIENIYLGETEKLVNLFNSEHGKGLASDNINDIARKAVEDRIKVILIESDKLTPGKVNLETGEVEIIEDAINYILDDISEMVLRAKGEVVMLPKERMPTDTGVAAIYRY